MKQKNMQGISARHNPSVIPKASTAGITLIALVITIVVLLILAGVSINVVLGDNGIVAKSKESVILTKLREYEEKVILITGNEKADKIIEEKEEALKQLVYDKLDEQDWVANLWTKNWSDNQEASLEDDEIKILTTDKYCIIVKLLENGEIIFISEGQDDGEPYPIIVKLEQQALEGEEGETIKINIEAEVEKGKKTEYIETIEVLNSEKNIIATKNYETLEVKDTFEVPGNGIYTFKVTTNCNKSTSKQININLEEVQNNIQIHAEPATARNTEKIGEQNGIETGPIEVTINYGETELQKIYKIENGEWQTVSGESTTFTVTENVLIVARYYDGINKYMGMDYEVQNVDNIAPTITTYDATVNGAIITVTAEATDAATEGSATSGIAGILRYEYSIDGKNYQTSDTFTVTEAGDYTVYIKAIDNAGNETIETKEIVVTSYTVSYDANGGSGAPSAQTTINGTSIKLSSTQPTRTGYSFLGWAISSTATSASYKAEDSYTVTQSVTLYAVWEEINATPVISSVSVYSRSTNHIEIRARATDADGDKLTYTLYYREQGVYKNMTVSTTANSGNYVYLKATGLPMYTIYIYQVSVTDGKKSTTSTSATTGTGCSGTTITETCTSATQCNGPYTTGTCTAASIVSSTTSAGPCSHHQTVTVYSYACVCCGKGYARGGPAACGCLNISGGESTHTCNNICSVHNTHGKHYYCNTHKVNCGSDTSHSYVHCEHNKTSTHYPN